MQKRARVSVQCDSMQCACNKADDPGHITMTAELQYVLCIMSPFAARKREVQGERMKSREYRRVERLKHLFLHRTADHGERAGGARQRAQYDEHHWRELSSMTLVAGCWQVTVGITVLGTVWGVQEEYERENGVCEAARHSAVGTVVVLAVTTAPQDVVLWHVGRAGRRVATETEVCSLRQRVLEGLARAAGHPVGVSRLGATQ